MTLSNAQTLPATLNPDRGKERGCGVWVPRALREGRHAQGAVITAHTHGTGPRELVKQGLDKYTEGQVWSRGQFVPTAFLESSVKQGNQVISRKEARSQGELGKVKMGSKST